MFLQHFVKWINFGLDLLGQKLSHEGLPSLFHWRLLLHTWTVDAFSSEFSFFAIDSKTCCCLSVLSSCMLTGQMDVSCQDPRQAAAPSPHKPHCCLMIPQSNDCFESIISQRIFFLNCDVKSPCVLVVTSSNAQIVSLSQQPSHLGGAGAVDSHQFLHTCTCPLMSDLNKMKNPKQHNS